ncbi:phage holin family protein [Demequina oxidasica]|uniref:phage holin family protein n=1 Tax=Demequina oxidasica TaxID=676199 RepID=UPI00078133E6|nr:phage holin family protein [Demequina oxidasica]
MIRLLIRALIFLASAALAIWVTSLLLDGFHMSFQGLIVASVIFAVVQAILSPFIFKMARQYANAFIGGVGLVSTFVSLLITALIVSGFNIDGVGTWIAATVLVWLITALASWLLPMWLLKEGVQRKRENNA